MFVEQKDEKTGEVKLSPKINITKRQNPATGEIVDVPIHQVEDLETRIHIVRLTVGNETIQKDLCGACLDKVRKKLMGLWTELDKLK